MQLEVKTAYKSSNGLVNLGVRQTNTSSVGMIPFMGLEELT